MDMTSQVINQGMSIRRLSKCLGASCASCGECYHHCREKKFTFKYPEDARPERVIWLVKKGKPLVAIAAKK